MSDILKKDKKVNASEEYIKPREFWIEGKLAWSESDISPQVYPPEMFIRVIEYSAYEAVCKERDEYKSNYEFKCERNGTNVIARDKAQEKLDALRNVLNGANRALAEAIKERDEFKEKWLVANGPLFQIENVKLRADLAIAVEGMEWLSKVHESAVPMLDVLLGEGNFLKMKQALAKISATYPSSSSK